MDPYIDARARDTHPLSQAEPAAAAHWYIRNWQQFGSAIPTIAELATLMGQPRKELLRLAQQDPLFKQQLDLLKELQRKILIDRALKGEVKGSVANKILEANHDMQEKQPPPSFVIVTVSPGSSPTLTHGSASGPRETPVLEIRPGLDNSVK